MSTTLGTLPIEVTAPALGTNGQPDTAAVLAFELSGAVDSSGNPITDPTTVATLVDAGDGTCTITEAADAPAGASVNLDATGVDPAGSPPVSSAASGATLTFVTPTATPPPPVSNIASVSLTVTSDPNESAPVAAPAEETPATPAAAATEETAAPAEAEPAAPTETNEAGWPTA